jgi:myo-inositol-1(or 4)-monophosphatase
MRRTSDTFHNETGANHTMTASDSLNLADTLRTAQDIAREAGDVIMSYFERPLNQSTKGTDVDIVTEADKQSEQVIAMALRGQYPDHHIVGEEGGGMGAAVETAAYRWYVDPLDGTTNFANRIPMFAVSMALTDAEMNPILGVVYNPVSQEMFSAARGKGAMLNGRRLTVSTEGTMQRCVLASGFPYDKYTSPENNLREWSAFLVRTRGLRRMGAAALDLCFVAAGRFDGYWEQKLNPWDALAGALCVLEAGGTVSGYRGETDAGIYGAGRLVASNGHIHQQMLDTLAEARGE